MATACLYDIIRLRSMIDRIFAGKIWNLEEVHWLGKSELTAVRLADTVTLSPFFIVRSWYIYSQLS